MLELVIYFTYIFWLLFYFTYSCRLIYVRDRSEEKDPWANKNWFQTIQTVLNILKYPHFKWMNFSCDILFAFELYDEGDYFTKRRGDQCGDTERNFWFVIGVMIMHRLIVGGLWLQTHCKRDNVKSCTTLFQSLFQNSIGHVKESIQRAVPTYGLWESFRWMAVFESFFFFISCVYFVAETLQPDAGEDCTLSYKDGFWAYACLVVSALSMLIVFSHEDRYLIPRKSYDKQCLELEGGLPAETYTLVQEKTDGELSVSKCPAGEFGLQEGDLIVGFEDFSETGNMANFDFTKYDKNGRIRLWNKIREEGYVYNGTLKVHYKREKDSSIKKSLLIRGLFFWRCAQIVCIVLARTYYIKAESASGTITYFCVLLPFSLFCQAVHTGTNAISTFLKVREVLVYGILNTLLVDIRYIPFAVDKSIASLPNIVLLGDFLFFYISYASESDDRNWNVVWTILALFIVTALGLIYIIRNFEIENYKRVRNRDIAKLLNQNKHALVEHLITHMIISEKELGENGPVKVVLMLAENDSVRIKEMIDILFQNDDYEDQKKQLMMRELCVRFFVAFDRGEGKHCPTIKASKMKEIMETKFTEFVEMDTINNFYASAHKYIETLRGSVKEGEHPNSFRKYYSCLAPVWHTKETSNDVMDRKRSRPSGRSLRMQINSDVRKEPMILLDTHGHTGITVEPPQLSTPDDIGPAGGSDNMIEMSPSAITDRSPPALSPMWNSPEATTVSLSLDSTPNNSFLDDSNFITSFNKNADELSLDLLCDFMLSGRPGRFIDELFEKIIFHDSVETNDRVDRDLTEHLKEFRFEVQDNYRQTTLTDVTSPNGDVKMRSLMLSPSTTSPRSPMPMTLAFEKIDINILRQFVREIPCLMSFSNKHLDVIATKLKVLDEQQLTEHTQITELDFIYFIKSGNVRMHYGRDKKMTLEVGDWFGGPMLEEGWKGKHQELKFFIGETDSAGTVLVSLAKKEYMILCKKAEGENDKFVDYTKRGPPAFDLLEKYQKEKESIESSGRISKNDRIPQQKSQRRTRHLVKEGRTDKALRILRKVPALAGLFSQEYKVVSKFCMMEYIEHQQGIVQDKSKHQRRSRAEEKEKLDCGKFLHIVHHGCGRIWRGNNDAVPTHPFRAINLESVTGQQSIYYVRSVNLLVLLLVHKTMFPILKPCSASLISIAENRKERFEEDVDWNDFLNDVGQVASGGFGTVRIMRHKDSGSFKAVKATSKGHIMQNSAPSYILQEQFCMYMVPSPFLVNLEGSLQDKNFTYLVMNFCPIDFHKFLVNETIPNPNITRKEKENGIYYPPEECVQFYAGCIILGLEALHSNGIAHRDIKPQNFLINFKGYLVITDLGFAKPIGNQRTYTVCGSREYYSPELARGNGYSYGSDIWAAGVSIYDTLTAYKPFAKPRQQLKKTVRPYLDFPCLSDNAKRLLGGLLAYKERERLGHLQQGGFVKLKAEPFFDGLDWNRLERCELEAPYKDSNFDANVYKDKKIKQARVVKYKPQTPDLFEDYYGIKYANNQEELKWSNKLKRDSNLQIKPTSFDKGDPTSSPKPVTSFPPEASRRNNNV